ncbi:MAG: response regulator transcription factor [Myxococcota bacterium]|nr:response regulator transcription factor [Myxococcota bacterium]
MKEILLIDDEPAITESLAYTLGRAGFQTRSVATLGEASSALEESTPALIILDLSLPDGHGFDWLRSLRLQSQTPLIILSSHDDEIEHIVGLEIGADDYINKPFSPREVVARVRAVLRRCEGGGGAEEEVSEERLDASGAKDRGAQRTPSARQRGRWSIDEARHMLCLDGVALDLSPLEFELLKALVEEPEIVHSRATLIRRAWAPGVVVSERTVDVHIKSIRRKLSGISTEAGELLLETVRGVGYRAHSGEEPREAVKGEGP